MNNLSQQEMKQYIYEEISQLKDHSKIVNLLQSNNIKYTDNNNGIYFNLSTSSDDIIEKIYTLLSNELLNMILTQEKDDTLKIMKEKVNSSKQKITPSQTSTIQEKEPLTLLQFTQRERDIIAYSKQYTL